MGPHSSKNSSTVPTYRSRFSSESRKVGDAGERAVVNYERDRLLKLGRRDLADRVRWHAAEKDFVGWDITSFDEDGCEIYIEVKSSIGETFSSFGLTVNEWQAACDPMRRERYLYLSRDRSALSRTAH